MASSSNPLSSNIFSMTYGAALGQMSKHSIRSSFREERGGLRASKERLDSARPTRKGRPESRPSRLRASELPDIGCY
jgi:hypothetical protein